VTRGEEIELQIDSAAPEGKSVARVDGMVVFVRGAAPGDRVRARITAVKKSFAEGETVRVLTPSPVRTEPQCRFFGVCGGCTWQHVAYPAQLEFKRTHVIDALRRIGGFRDVQVHPTLGCDQPYGYRNKMEFSFGDLWHLHAMPGEAQEHASGEARFALGLHIPGRFDKVLDIDECWLQSATSAAIVNAVRDFALERNLPVYSSHAHNGYLRNLVIRSSVRTSGLMINLVTFDDRSEVMEEFRDAMLQKFPGVTTIVNNITARVSQVAVGEREVVYFGPGTITERIGKRVYRISANSFFQTNTVQAERLYDTAQRLAGLRSDDVVYDLYCGTGTIALHVADDVREVVGIEAIQSAVDDAAKNASDNGVRNCTFIRGDLKDSLTRDTAWQSEHPDPDVIIVDPPRAGMHEKVVLQLRALAPRRIVYVSCNPATQARDLKILCQDALYTLDEVQPVDMFPHTVHIESVAALSIRKSL